MACWREALALEVTPLAAHVEPELDVLLIGHEGVRR
jgi:hypothetical protein